MKKARVCQAATLRVGPRSTAWTFGADYRSETGAPLVTKLEVGTLKYRNGEPGKGATLAFEGRCGLMREADENDDV